MMKRFFLLSFALLSLGLSTTACDSPESFGGITNSGSISGAGSGTKSFFSVWTYTGGQFSINMSGFNQSGTPVSGRWSMSDGTYCSCSFSVTATSGTESNTAGSFVTSGCSTIGTGEAATFCPCVSNTSMAYSQNGDYLTLQTSCGGLASFQ
jgi:predicted small secreted protein